MSKIEEEGVPVQEDIFRIKASDVKKLNIIGKGELNTCLEYKIYEI